MEAVGHLAGGVAHDFNNGLSVILGYCDMSHDALDADHRAVKYIRQIRKAAERGADLTSQLLAFSRRETVKLSILNLNAVVNDVSRSLLRLVGDDIVVKFVPGAPLGSVRADLGQMHQVLMNLAVNARDAMPNGGTISIATSNVELDDSYARVHPGAAAGSYVMLSVKDTGCGMDSKTQSRIFEPFFTTKAPGEGTGLGLSTVSRIVKQSGGHILVESEPGKGTTFKLYFARTDEMAISLVPSTRETIPLAGSETILVVEDDDSLRRLTSDLLESEGYRVLTARDAATAIAIASQHPNAVDLVLTDVVMPDMSGGTLAARLEELHSGLKVAYMSGYSHSLVSQGEWNSGRKLLRKPFTRRSLLVHVRSALDEVAALIT